MYLIAFRDCCGKNICGRCLCPHAQGSQPIYRIQRNNELIWCFGAGQEVTYHCSIAPIVSEL
jgi:methylamine dehydrogenase light chain